jgi:diaminopimelate epimerase
MKIPFVKAHGARNDFLLTWADEVPAGADLAALAQAICDRHTGIGADGWMLVSRPADADAAIVLLNSDGSPSEISGNGTRCAAAFALHHGIGKTELAIRTGAGVKTLRLLERSGLRFTFEMNMGAPAATELRATLALAAGPREVHILDLGNPQCALVVDDFEFDWRAMGREIEWHLRFPRRTNVSFLRPAGTHEIEVRIWERGAGETLSSGTGSSGAAAAAILLGLAASPLVVRTAAGPLDIRWQPPGDLFLKGPAEIVARGEFWAG